MRHVRVAVVTLILLTIEAAGQFEAAGQLPGPSLALRDSIVLEEDDDHYVSLPVGLSLGPNGSFLISDAGANSVLQFDSTGGFVRRFGGPGRGPGEFMGIGQSFATADIVGAHDTRGMKLNVFRYDSGEPVGSVGLSVAMTPTILTVLGDSVWITGTSTSRA